MDHTTCRARKGIVPLSLAMSFLLVLTLSGMSAIGIAFSGQDAALLRLPALVSIPWSPLSQAGTDPTKGMFLVASQDLRDPNFSETVVLLIDYNPQGAMGLVINRPTQMKLSTVLPEIEGLKKRNDTVYIGGPVARMQMMLLIRSVDPPDGSLHIFEDVYVSSSGTVIQRMIDAVRPEERFRIYMGYAGWAPGQLDRELSRGDWHLLQADTETLFDRAPQEIWQELIRQSPLLIANLQRPDWDVKSAQKPSSMSLP